MKMTGCAVGSMVCLLGLLTSAATAGPAQPAKGKTRIGTYDSRAIVVGYSLSPMQIAAEGTKAAEYDAAWRKANASGDKKQIDEVNAKYSDVVKGLVLRHKQCFSTAPADDIVAHIQDQLPEIRKAARVEALVCKWDKQAMAKYKDAEKVDVTMAMVYAFHPTMAQFIRAMEILDIQPIPLEKAEKMDWMKGE